MDAKKLGLEVKRKFPALSAKEINMMIIRVKKANKGTLTGLTMAACMGLVKKDIHDEHKRKDKEWKDEKRELGLTCTICFHTFANESSCKRHMQGKHGKVRHEATVKDKTGFDKKCPHCNRFFKYEFSREYHVERFHSKDDKTETCSTLDEASSFVCKKCEKVFRHKPSLKRHMITHDENEGFDCDRCDANFRRKDNLVKHEKRVHSLGNLNVGLIRGEDSREFVCKMCGRNFGPDRIKYEAHLMLRVCQTKDRNIEIDDKLKFPCDHCEKTYNEKDSLDRHVRWKHGDPIQAFKCLECDSSFKYKSSLKRHMDTEHTGNDLVV